MNSKSLEKIQAAASFLKWFRSYLPESIQNRVRPYLDQPYQLALKVMDCCNGSRCQSLQEIAVATKVSKNTASQVLSALRNGGLVIILGTSSGRESLALNPVEKHTSSDSSAGKIDERAYSGVEEQRV